MVEEEYGSVAYLVEDPGRTVLGHRPTQESLGKTTEMIQEQRTQ